MVENPLKIGQVVWEVIVASGRSVVASPVASGIWGNEAVALFFKAFRNLAPCRTLVEVAMQTDHNGLAGLAPFAEANSETTNLDESLAHMAAYPAVSN